MTATGPPTKTEGGNKVEREGDLVGKYSREAPLLWEGQVGGCTDAGEKGLSVESPGFGTDEANMYLKQQHQEDDVRNLWISFYRGTCAKEDRREVVRTGGLIAREK